LPVYSGISMAEGSCVNVSKQKNATVIVLRMIMASPPWRWSYDRNMSPCRCVSRSDSRKGRRPHWKTRTGDQGERSLAQDNPDFSAG